MATTDGFSLLGRAVSNYLKGLKKQEVLKFHPLRGIGKPNERQAVRLWPDRRSDIEGVAGRLFHKLVGYVLNLPKSFHLGKQGENRQHCVVLTTRLADATIAQSGHGETLLGVTVLAASG